MTSPCTLTPPSHGTPSLCSDCTALPLSLREFTVLKSNPTAPTPESDTTPLRLDPIDLGFLDSIYDRRWGCQFCRLIYDGARAGPKCDLRDDGRDKDGNRISCRLEWQLDTRASASLPMTRRLRVSTSCGSVPFFHIVPLAVDDQSSMMLGFGKRITPQANLPLVGQWFRTCTQQHPCGHPARGSNSIRPARLLDVSNHPVRLVPTPSPHTEYAALSYVWGKFIPAGVDWDTLRKYSSTVIDQVPLTVRNAFHVVRSLGINFIWVDAFCINQGDQQDVRREIAIMDRIYRNAVLTVCAASGTSTDGMSGVDGVTRHPAQGYAAMDRLQLTTLPPVADLIAATHWDSRGWTLQERLLSRRCAVFTPTEILWQCPHATWRESISLPLDRGLWTLDFIDSPYIGLQENPLRRYASCVDIYSGRTLTFTRDKLLAFEGLGQDLATGLNSELLFGLPRRYFDWAVLWEPKAVGSRLPHPSDSLPPASFPSWGWCGWDHAVEWRLSTLSGALFDLHAWLMTRTWIVWRYAGEDGSWELVWDREQPSSGAFDRGRWEGYLPEHRFPYGRSPMDIDQVIGDFHSPEDTDAPATPPSKATQLAFTTFTGRFRLSTKSLSTAAFSSDLGPGLRRFGIVDGAGDWCGTVVLGEKEWMPRVEGVFEFAAISTAKDFSMEEMDTWNYYIPEKQHQGDWYCFYALMIMPVRDEVFERVGLAKIFASAFRMGSIGRTRWRRIILE
ncbi:HET domain-containing protein [Aspergillus ibericus CBS 121593]|uniref:HET-domain-containing protein n=1 Tax=Aspergillus ibericus CBS 121593 TaxID=1448316 RepID=A0A395GRM9_9EURO|nr:HET-domain-containing protein [Aspergillus ibericus CBS 121593]RAK98099.1 HET-domain-containing protein [Aspergillus ibericus CBS 121593]